MKYFLLIVIVSLSCDLNAQLLQVLDKESNSPISGVLVSSQSVQQVNVTNAKGQVDLSAFSDDQTIELRSLGYTTGVYSVSDLESNGFKVGLEPSDLNLNEVVVSASRWMQSTEEIPVTSLSVTKKSIALQNPQTTADLLGISGKVFIQKSQQGGGSPMIRGFATNRLLYAVDGVRMNTAIFRSGNLQNVINIDPFSLERTEVVFGPGSVIYGSDAIGGVMSFQTLHPQFSVDGNMNVSGNGALRYATANQEKAVHADVNLGWKKWALVTSVSAWDFDDLRQGSHGPADYLKEYHVERHGNEDVVVQQDDPLLQVPSAYSQINLMQKLRFTPSKNWDLQYGFHYSETSDYGRYDRHNRVRNGTARYAEWDYGPQMWMMNHLQIDHKGSTRLYDQMTLRLAQQSFEESRIDRALNSSERTTNTEEVQAYSVNVDWKKQLGFRHSLYYGAEYVIDDVASTGAVTDIDSDETNSGPSRYPDAIWSSLAIYANDEMKINSKLMLQAGLRYNYYYLNADFSDNLDFYPFDFNRSKTHDGALTGSLGFVFRPMDSWVIKIHTGTAFRSPNVDDIGKVFDSEPGAVVVPNPNLKAEYAYNAELSMAKVFVDRVKVEVSAYYTYLEDAMVRRDYALDGMDSIVYDGELSKVQAIQNAANAKVYGVQVGLDAELMAGFSLSSDLNWQHGEEEMDDGSTSPSRHAAPFFGVARLKYDWKSLSLQFYSQFQGRRSHSELSVSEQEKDEIYALDDNGETYVPSWYTLNLKGMYTFYHRLTLFAGIENLTDQRYRPYSSGISAPGRNYIVSARFTF